MTTIPQWIHQVQSELGRAIFFGRMLGKGLFIIKASKMDAMRKLMMFFPFRCYVSWGVFQQWVLDFDLGIETGVYPGSKQTTSGLKIPTWIILQNLQIKLQGMAEQIIAGLGKVLEASIKNSNFKDPKFYVELHSFKDRVGAFNSYYKQADLDHFFHTH